MIHFRDNETCWFKVSVANYSTQPGLWLFELLDPHIRKVRVVQVTSNDTVEFPITGYIQNFNSRSTNHKNYVFPIDLKDSLVTTIYFSIYNDYPLTLNVGIRPALQLLHYSLGEYFLLGFFYGILLIMAVYNFFIYFSTRESVYLYYVAFVISYCLNAFQEDGLGFQYLWPNHAIINPAVTLFAPMLFVLSFALYSNKFLLTRQYSKNLHFSIIYTLFFYCFFYLVNHYALHFVWMRYLYLVPFILVFLTGIVTSQRGNRTAKYFLYAFSSLFVFFTIVALRITKIIPTTIYTVYALNFGFLFEVVLFSYAMGQRLKIQKEEKTESDRKLIEQLRENEILKDKMNKELEHKVEERTYELANALSALKTKNLEVENLNILLEKDNQVLNQDIKDINKARLMLKDLTFEEFKKIYPDEISCLRYLAEIKWGKHYFCKKCANGSYSLGKSTYSRRCTKCGYDESVTSNTLFHNSKIPITSTFYLVYLVLAHRNISSHDLSEKLALRQKTCWSFKKKILETIEQSGTPKLTSKEWGKIFYN